MKKQLALILVQIHISGLVKIAQPIKQMKKLDIGLYVLDIIKKNVLSVKKIK